MWRVKLGAQTVYEPDNLKLSATFARLETELSEPGTLELQIPYGHALYNQLAAVPLLSDNWFSVERDGGEIWRGRLVQRSAKPLDGVMILLCEGELGLFNDSVCPPYSATETQRDYLARLIGYHNSQVEPWKRFNLGRVVVADVNSTGQITRGVESPTGMMQELLAKTCNSSTGGYLMVRRENGARYLDWLSDPAIPGVQPIKTAYNLLSVEDVSDGSEFHTAVYALGAQIDTGGGVYKTLTLEGLEDRTDQSTAKVGGLVINTDLQAQHGVIARVVSWDDVTDVDNLYTRARQYARSLSEPRAVEVGAVDMSLTGQSVEPFSIGQRVPVDTPTFGGSALVTAVKYDLLDPGGGSVTFGDVNAVPVDQGDVISVKTTGTGWQVANVTQQVQTQQQQIQRLIAQGGTVAGPSGVLPYAAVDGTSTATAFTATIAGVDAYADGLAVVLHNGVITSASGFTIDINGLGAKHCYNNMTNATQDTTIFNVAYTMLFIYDSSLDSGAGGWWCYRGYDSNTNTIGYQLRTNSSSLVSVEKGYRYRIWLTVADGTKMMPINTSTATNSTTARSLNTRAFDPFGRIVYRSTNATLDANTALGATAIWDQYTLTIGYSYVKTLTYPAPVYIKATPQADGSAVMADIVQALPNSADGYIYVFLGYAYSATAMELYPAHPVYWHDGSGVRLWTGASSSTGDVVSAVDGWRVERRADGIITATKTESSSIAVNTSYGSVYYSATQTVNLPTSVFSSVDWASVNTVKGTGIVWTAITALSATQLKYWVASATSLTASAFNRNIIVRGR